MRSLSLVVAFLVALSAAASSNEIPLKSWGAPPYWSPPQSAPDHGGRDALVLPSSPLPFVAIVPCRQYDSRFDDVPLQQATPRTVTLIGGTCAIPADAQAVAANITIVNILGAGGNGVFKVGTTSPPTVGWINYPPTETQRANAGVLPLGAGGTIVVEIAQGGGSVDLIVDVFGYYSPLGIVNSLNTLTGNVTLAAGSNVSITPGPGSLTIAAASGGGTVTSVATGAGLTGGTITSTGTISVAPLGITTGLLADNAVTGAKLALGAVGLAQIDPTQVQARGASTCPQGSTIRALNADGSVVCAASAPPGAGYSLTTVDSAGDVGYDTSITIGSDGFGLVSYYDSTNGNLKVAHCANTACTSATTATVDNSAGDVGLSTSITIGSDGLGLISYLDNTNADLKVAHCSNTACTSATTSTLNSVGDVGYYTSITIGSDGLGLISYHDATNFDLRVAHCSNTLCTIATTSALETVGFVGWYTAITIGTDGLGLISYYDVANGALKVAHCSNTACTSATTSTVDSASGVGTFTSIAIGPDGLGLISYYDNTNFDLKVAHCSNTACTSATTSTLDSVGNVGAYTAIAIGSDGFGLISYYDNTNFNLKVAHCANAACTSATLSTSDGAGTVGGYTSITIGADGLGLISYNESVNGDLRVAHCANVACTPFVVKPR